MYNSIVISTFLALISSFSLGVYSLIRNPKALVVRLWFLFSMSISIWAVGYLWASLAKNEADGFSAIRILYIGATFAPILFFHFVATFLFKVKGNRYLLIAGYLLSLLFSFSIASTNYIIQGAKFIDGLGFYENISVPGFYIFLSYFLVLVLYSISLLISQYGQSDGIRRRQIYFLIIASLIGFVGAATNFLAGIFGIYPYGQLIVWLYPIFITYGIFIQEIKIKITF